VIASDFPVWRKMLADVDCALFVNPLDARAIAKAIEYLLSHPERAEAMGRCGQAAVAERFNWNTQAGKLIDLYRNLASTSCVA
jgi:glycosyltransferase involved in cell wall biosynthesis